jgi:formate/nitrite transporter FocA (FNT family)
VLLANIVGAALFAWAVAFAPVFEPSVRQALDALAPEAMSHPFWTILVRGIFAGWLIALMVWLMPFAESARVWVIVIVTYIVGLEYLAQFLVPTLAGNVIGGVSIVAAIAHAQYVAHAEPAHV